MAERLPPFPCTPAPLLASVVPAAPQPWPRGGLGPVFLSGLLGSRGRWSSQVLAEDWLQQFLHICPREVSAITPQRPSPC